MRSNIFKDETYSFIRIHDDNTCAGGSQPSHTGGDISPDEEVLSIEDLARQFNVSTKTISRWRDHGLVAQRVVLPQAILNHLPRRLVREVASP